MLNRRHDLHRYTFNSLCWVLGSSTSTCALLPTFNSLCWVRVNLPYKSFSQSIFQFPLLGSRNIKTVAVSNWIFTFNSLCWVHSAHSSIAAGDTFTFNSLCWVLIPSCVSIIKSTVPTFNSLCWVHIL